MIIDTQRYYCIDPFTCDILVTYHRYHFFIGNVFDGKVIKDCIPKEFHKNFSTEPPGLPEEAEFFEDKIENI